MKALATQSGHAAGVAQRVCCVPKMAVPGACVDTRRVSLTAGGGLEMGRPSSRSVDATMDPGRRASGSESSGRRHVESVSR